MRYRISALLMGLMVSAACTPSEPGGSNGGNGGGGNGGGGSGQLTGELVYFSGRPPPEWTIPATDHSDISQRLEGISSTTAPELFPRFGPVAYRIVNESRINGIPDQVLVQGGLIQIEMSGTYSYFNDDNGLEAALKASAQAAGAYAELGLDD